MSDRQERLAALQAKGWQVVSATDHDKERGEPGLVILERLVSSKAVRAIGRDLTHAVEDAEQLDRRLADHASFVRSAHGDVGVSSGVASA